MVSKLFFILLFFSFSFASFQEVYVGKIDPHYKNKITKEELKTILSEIEYTFESQLSMNIFDYNKNGKEINLVYVPPSKLEKRISKKLELLRQKEKKIEKLTEDFPQELEKIDILKSDLAYKSQVLNNKIEDFNKYVGDINKKKSVSREEYNSIQAHVKSKKKLLNKEIKSLKQNERKVQRAVNRYNQKINSYNNLINQFNRISKELEIMGRNFKKVKGMTFGVKEVKVKTVFNNGKKTKQRSEKTNMDKIEIYGFESKNELKAILAHEIGHLVGVPHVSAKNALMNPVIQKSQIEYLYLSKEDIEAFISNF